MLKRMASGGGALYGRSTTETRVVSMTTSLGGARIGIGGIGEPSVRKGTNTCVTLLDPTVAGVKVVAGTDTDGGG